ncbi:hypothetical protein FCULG_00010286 [Fusarium culmorum]|uniref:Uncharacterized protein n=1 Tax=Fusarium culmorum TaxID=5516 RepID=A0A2T4GDA2_FUSCU|nr:hypothetical protein FCULG_00010286 [Fusarium culmorum]
MAANRIIIIVDDDQEELHPQQPRPQNESAHLIMDGIQAAFNFVRSRPSGAIINNENGLTLRELQALSTFLQSLSETMNTPATIADFRRFLLNIFDGWNSISQVPPHPLIPDRKFMDTRIKVGLLREDHPLSRNQLNGGGNSYVNAGQASQYKCRRLGLERFEECRNLVDAGRVAVVECRPNKGKAKGKAKEEAKDATAK